MKIAIRHILVTLAWVGPLLGHQLWAQDWATPQPTSQGRAEIVSPGERQYLSADDSSPDAAPSVVGEHQMPIGGAFGDTPPAACEFCGGGGCLPPTWSIEPSVSLMAISRPANQRLGVTSLPAGPLPAGTTNVTNSGIVTAETFNQYLNDAVQITALEGHTPVPTVSPAFGLKIGRFLGRDGEARDHFLEFGFQGFESYTASTSVNGSIIPFYNTTPFVQAIPAIPPPVEYYQGSLVSPFPIYLANIGNQQQQITQSFSTIGRIYDNAFNRSTVMSTSYAANFNEWELNYRFDGHNQPDQLVMNPNGRWYRECQHGYYYSYFFGLRSMVIDEKSDYFSAGSQYATNTPDNGSPGALLYTHQGDYSVHTYNTLLGLQTGGKLEYRFCRWCMDAHGNAGMYLNFARQDSLITTSFGGPTPPSYGATPIDRSDPSSASSAAVAFAGGFGVAGTYKFLPNLVGHISYDMLWVGDVARAPEQMIFSSVPESVRNLINTKGSVFYDGFSFGLEMDW